jgi:hypothetical protein
MAAKIPKSNSVVEGAIRPLKTALALNVAVAAAIAAMGLRVSTATKAYRVYRVF